MNTRPIGIFDSGVGGLTVFKEIKKMLPKEDIIYLGDTKNFPYGSKSKETILEISDRCVQRLLKKQVKLIIIACGTATSQSLEELQKKYEVPILGIIEPTVEYLLQKQTKELLKIGIIGTRGTIRSNRWQIEIEQKLQNTKIINQECPLLAPMAEEGWTQNEVARHAIKEYMKPFLKEGIDTLILGCTHYPLFKELIQQSLGSSVEILNTGEKLAIYLKEYIHKKQLAQLEEHTAKYEIYLTDTECNFTQVARQLLKEEEIAKTIQEME